MLLSFRLWHQLTLQLQKFVKMLSVNQSDALMPVCIESRNCSRNFIFHYPFTALFTFYN